jgi:acyl-CoA synthetase (AMP-forming)/AMP-acid ligase II
LDRKKDMIIRSGLKIFPVKVEQVLRRHPRVADVAVVGRADPVHTEIVVAVVVLQPAPAKPEKAARPEDRDVDHTRLAEELRSLCREHLAPYEVPAQIEFVPQLPRSPLGKLLKRELRNSPPAGSSAPAPAIPAAAPVQSSAAQAEGNGHPERPGPNGNGSGGKKPDKQKEAA